MYIQIEWLKDENKFMKPGENTPEFGNNVNHRYKDYINYIKAINESQPLMSHHFDMKNIHFRLNFNTNSEKMKYCQQKKQRKRVHI